MHTVELKCVVELSRASDAFFSRPTRVRDFFEREGSCSIINNWTETVTLDGQKMVRYTIILKFDDQMVANSVKQKYNNKIIHGTRIYADWYNTAETKKKKKKSTTVEEDEFLLSDEEETMSYPSVLSSTKDCDADSKSSSHFHATHTYSRRSVTSDDRRASPRSSRSQRSHSKGSSRRDSDSTSVSPPRPSYRSHSLLRHRTGRRRSYSNSPDSSRGSSPVRDRKERYLDASASLNDERYRSTRSSTSINDKRKFIARSRNSREKPSRQTRSPSPCARRNLKRSESDSGRLSPHKRSRGSETPVADKKQADEDTPAKPPIEFTENLVDVQQRLNIFDLISSDVKELKSGDAATDAKESGSIDFATCKRMLMEQYIEDAKILASDCKILASYDPTIANHLQFSVHGNMVKLIHMYLHGLQRELGSIEP